LGQSLTKYDTSKKEDVEIYYVNLAEEPKLAKRFKVRSFPVLVYLKKGEFIAKERGVRSVDELRENVKKYFK